MKKRHGKLGVFALAMLLLLVACDAESVEISGFDTPEDAVIAYFGRVA